MIQETTDFEWHVQNYWRLSRIWHGRSKEQATTEDGIAVTNYILEKVNPMRPLWNTVANLQCDIVEYGNKSRKKRIPQKAIILIFAPLSPTGALIVESGAVRNA